MSVLLAGDGVNLFRCCGAATIELQRRINTRFTDEKKPPDDADGFFETRNDLNLFDRFEHLECGLIRADKKTLEVFTQTLALQRITTSALFFSSHGDLLNVIAISESIEL